MQGFWLWLKKRWIWLVLLVAAILSFVLYGVKAQPFNKHKKDADTVRGVVIRSEHIVKNYGTDDGADVDAYYKVTYRYEYNGTTYHNTCHVEQNMKEGKQIRVQIDPKDPTVVFYEGDTGLVYLIVGVLCVLPVVFYAGFALRKERRLQKSQLG